MRVVTVIHAASQMKETQMNSKLCNERSHFAVVGVHVQAKTCAENNI